MKVAIMQPYFLPYIGYFQLINAVDKFIIYDDVNYIKQGWINKNNILVQSKSFSFTIPLESPSSYTKIKDIKVSNKQYETWKRKIILTIQQNYKKAPYFFQSFDLVSDILNQYIEGISISEFNYLSLKKIVIYLNINTKIIQTSAVYNNCNLKGQDRIIDICIKENVSTYINPIGGIELYDKSDFKKENIDLNFIKTDNIEYKQLGEDFVPWLSILDVLMFNSIDEIKNLLNKFTLL